jgi:hypothetical protein
MEEGTQASLSMRAMSLSSLAEAAEASQVAGEASTDSADPKQMHTSDHGKVLPAFAQTPTLPTYVFRCALSRCVVFVCGLVRSHSGTVPAAAPGDRRLLLLDTATAAGAITERSACSEHRHCRASVKMNALTHLPLWMRWNVRLMTAVAVAAARSVSLMLLSSTRIQRSDRAIPQRQSAS